MKNTFYRGISKNEYSKELIKHHTTQRTPSNIPYVVDNIWEWLRPKNMPSRRYSVYASPVFKLAQKYATVNDMICIVELHGDSKAVQLAAYQDAKLHPDVRTLPKFIMTHLGQKWLESDIESKLNVGKLFIPLLSKEEVESILNTSNMRKLKEQIIKESLFWNDISIVDDDYELTEGELFFHSKDGYKLINM